MALPRTVIIVDDNPEDRATLRRYLSRQPEYQNRVFEADTAEAGLEICRTVVADCILLDYVLPNMDGLEFLKILNAEFPYYRIPAVVMLTGSGNEQIAVQAMKNGAQDYLIKSRMRPEQLFQAVNAAVQFKRIELALYESNRRTSILYRLTAALLETLTPRQVAEVIVNDGLIALDAHLGIVTLLNESTNQFEVLVEKNIAMNAPPGAPPLPSALHKVLGEAISTQATIWIEMVEDFKQHYPALEHGDIQSVVCIPLTVNGRVVGGIGVGFHEPQRFSEEKRVFMLTIAHQCAQALERARLYAAESEARHEAEKANDLKVKFLAMISHELRTPLTSIKGFTSTLLAPDVRWSEDDQHQFISIVDEETDKLTDLVEQLIDISLLQAGTLRLYAKRQPFHNSVDVAATQLATLSVNHQLIFNIPPELPPIAIDEKRIAQVLVNLVSNAVKHSPEGTPIVISAHLHSDELQVDVIDQGEGIPVSERETVFEAFRQVDHPNKLPQGTGLGLAICKGIISGHKGNIWIQNQNGTGTTVSFTLPLLNHQDTKNPEKKKV